MAILKHLLVGGPSALPNNRSGRFFTMPFTIDTAKVNVGSGDIVKLLNIPANVLVRDVVANVKTAEGETLTIDIGDYLEADDAAIDADGYIDGANGNSVAAVKASTFELTEGAPNTVGPAYTTGKFYPAATSYIGVLFNNAADAAVIDVHVLCENCNY